MLPCCRADTNKNGTIESDDELRACVALWYLHVTRKLEQQETLRKLSFNQCCCFGQRAADEHEWSSLTGAIPRP